MSPVFDRRYAAVLFDLDGTLVSSEPVVLRSWRTVYGEFDFPAGAHVRHGVPARDQIAEYLHDRPQADRDAALARIVSLEENDTDGLTVLPGARAALQSLAGTGRGAIVTSCPRRLAEVRLRAVGLPSPGALVTADDVTRGKPDPEPYLAGAAALGVPATDCLVVEDAPAGVAAGRAAGADVLALVTTHPAGELDGDCVVADLAAVRLLPEPAGVRLATAG